MHLLQVLQTTPGSDLKASTVSTSFFRPVLKCWKERGSAIWGRAEYLWPTEHTFHAHWSDLQTKQRTTTCSCRFQIKGPWGHSNLSSIFKVLFHAQNCLAFVSPSQAPEFNQNCVKIYLCLTMLFFHKSSRIKIATFRIPSIILQLVLHRQKNQWSSLIENLFFTWRTKIIACLWRSSLQLWTRSMETQRSKTPSSTGSCDIFLSFSFTPSTGSALKPYKTIQFTHLDETKSHLTQITPLEAELLHQSHSAPSCQWPSSPISSFLPFVQVYTTLHFW